jgi:hypothetical protein
MLVIAEIADKMPSSAAVAVACLVAAGVGVALAATHRAVAWTVLSLALPVGACLSAGAYRESLLGGPFSDTIRGELGWSWVAVSIGGPLLPAAAVAASMILRRLRCIERAGHCTACGYDLRATPARCPECGAAGTMPPSP